MRSVAAREQGARGLHSNSLCLKWDPWVTHKNISAFVEAFRILDVFWTSP